MFATRRSAGRLTPTRKLVKKGSSLRDLRPLTERIVLEKVLGVTLKGNSGLACSPVTGEIAFPAGCVIVLVNSNGHGQSHIVNSSKKTISSLAFSPDGKFLVSGESGHQPAVRVWDAEDSSHPQVSELSKGHKHGIQSVAFSPNMKYVVSVGFHHDMLVNIWNWREETTIACNKVSSKVNAISFSEKGDYFVTVGVRIVKFWYIGSTDDANKVKKKIPLQGRPAILGEKRDNQFIDVACGVGVNSALTYSVTKSGLLCSFNQKRLLEKWVELRVNGAFSLAVNEELIFCGCSDGIIRVFNSSTLQFIGSLPKPHCLGVDVAAGHDASHLLTKVDNASYPDTVAITLDHQGTKLTCVYNDHSIYVWDIKDIKKIGKISSFLYHNSCIWGIEVFPDVSSNDKIPYGSFLTCSADGTVRVWNIETGSKMAAYRNIYSKELIQVIYTEKDLSNLKDTKSHKENGRKEPEIKPGLRCVKLSPEGKQLASGDRMGNIRIFDVAFMHEIIKIEAHESEVLCIEYSSPDADFNLLASAGRDRLIHVFDCDSKFNLIQTIDDHSASITSIRFNLSESKDFQLISCAADKSVIFRAAQKDPELQFTRYTNVATKTTFYDMDIHPSNAHAVTAGQDRNMRVYDIASGKQLRSFKGAMGDDGIILKVLLDRSGFYVATSCSDKSLALFDFDIGECVAGMVGHSEIVTGLQFSLDCERLITVAGDGCIFVWKLPSAFCQNMMEKMHEQEYPNKAMLNDVTEVDGSDDEFRPATNDMFEFKESNSLLDDYRLSTINKLPTWAKKQVITNVDMEVSVITESAQNTSIVNTRAKPEGRWAERFNPLQIFPDTLGETDKGVVEGSPETKPFPNHLDLLANTPLEKRYSNGSLNDESIFSENAEAVLQLYEKEIPNKALENLQSTVTVSRGSDINIEATEKCRIEEDSRSSDHNDSGESREIDEDIIYYPNEEDLDGEVASLANDSKTNPSGDSQTNPTIKADTKSEDKNATRASNTGYKIPLKKRTIEDILQSPIDEVGYFEMRSGHSMDNLIIHEVEFDLFGRRGSTEQSLEAVPYDVKIFEDCGDEKELESQSMESSPKDETDEPTGDSISDEEDILTTEIVPKWDELPEIPAPSFERADIESNKEFFIENFECLGSTPTEDKEEPLFQSPAEVDPTEPLPFERNSFHRTSLSAIFIRRSKRSYTRLTQSNGEAETSSTEITNVLEQKNIELEKRKEQLQSTKKRLESMGFKSIDNWTKKHTMESDAKEELTINMKDTEGEQMNEKQSTIPTLSKPDELTREASHQKEPDKASEISKKTEDSFCQKPDGLVFEKTEVLSTDELRENEAVSPSKKASELIVFFDTGQQDKASKTKANKKAEKSQTRTKLDEKKVKDKYINGKTSKLNKLKDEEKQAKSQNRKSFPFSLAKLTKTKASDRRRSAPKTNISKAKSCGDLLTEQKDVIILEQRPTKQSVEEQKNDDVLTKQDSKKHVHSELSELSAELSAALATPAPKVVELNLSRDYLMGNGDVSTGYRSLTNTEKAFSSEVTTNECQEVVVNLVRAFERALDCHSKILNGDIKDSQRQGLSMLAATFTTIHENITEWKSERERRNVRSKNTETNSEKHAKTRDAETQHSQREHVETKDISQQTEHVFTTNESEQITPLLEKYSELLLKKFEDKMSN